MTETINTIRHAAHFNPSGEAVFNKQFTVIGAGAIGSFTVMQLASLGIRKIAVYDFDVVESHNLANQAYGMKHIGMKKVDALKELVLEKTGIEIEAHDERVGSEHTDLGQYVFLLPDNMASRREIYENALKMNFSVELVTEARMGLEFGHVYTFDPKSYSHFEKWEKTLYSDDEVSEPTTACGSKLALGTTASTLANIAVANMINWTRDCKDTNHVLMGLNPFLLQAEKFPDF